MAHARVRYRVAALAPCAFCALVWQDMPRFFLYSQRTTLAMQAFRQTCAFTCFLLLSLSSCSLSSRLSTFARSPACLQPSLCATKRYSSFATARFRFSVVSCSPSLSRPPFASTPSTFPSYSLPPSLPFNSSRSFSAVRGPAAESAVKGAKPKTDKSTLITVASTLLFFSLPFVFLSPLCITSPLLSFLLSCHCTLASTRLFSAFSYRFLNQNLRTSLGDSSGPCS